MSTELPFIWLIWLGVLLAFFARTIIVLWSKHTRDTYTKIIWFMITALCLAILGLWGPFHKAYPIVFVVVSILGLLFAYKKNPVWPIPLSILGICTIVFFIASTPISF